MRKFFTLICVALVSAIGYAQDAYDPSAHTCVVSGTSNLCSGYWSSEDAMTYDAGSGLWKITLTATDTEAIEFKVVYDGNWYGKEGGDANFKFQVEEPSDVDITFDPTTNIATYSGAKVKDYGFTLDDVQYIVVAGSSALLNGLEWNIDPTESEPNKMTAEDRGFYTLELANIPAGTYEFKFVANGSWSAAQWGAFEGEEALEQGVAKSATTDNGKNFKITLEKGSLYNVTLTLDITNFSSPMVTAEWVAAGDAPIEEDVYSVAGSFNSWDIEDEHAELTKVSEGVYSITHPLKAGSYEFKVALNHSWAVAYPAENYKLDLAKDYDITITLDITGEPTITVDTTECSVYFVNVIVKSTKDNVYMYGCYGDNWTNMTGSWPGEPLDDMRDKEVGGFVSEDMLLPRGEKLWLIFNDNNGGQTANIEVNGINANATLTYTLNDDWTFTTSSVQAVAAEKTNGAIYNIAGQRVEKAVRGLYIINGKKVAK